MIILWVQNFMRDEDLCLVDYKSFSDENGIEFPQVSYCFVDPFIEYKFKDLGINTTTYIRHLSGEDYNENLTHINHTDVTLNLQSYLNNTSVGYGNVSVYDHVDVDIHTTYNGFRFGQFVKCFSIEMRTLSMDNVQFILHGFKFIPLQMYLGNVQMSVHTRQQFFLQDSGKHISLKNNETNGSTLGLVIKKVEVLKRRNKPKEPCLEQYGNWDETAILGHMKHIGCSAPYHKVQPNIPICNTKREMKQWVNMVANIKHKYPNQPCQQMPRIDFEIETRFIVNEGILGIFVEYPEHAKVITQSRAVDINTLIGNIGGYIGLFLGI